MNKKERVEKEKVVIIFIEGDTEVAFYKRLIAIMRTHCNGRLACSIEVKNAYGIGQYKDCVLRIFKKQVKPKYPSGEFYVALCYDQDVFEMGKNPPINWKDIKSAFLANGANEVQLIKAVHSIEDWFLCDIEGIFKYLHLPEHTKLPSGNGYGRLKSLFKKGNKLYIKGTLSKDFVQALDVEKILLKNCHEISPLCKLLGVNCEKRKRCCTK